MSHAEKSTGAVIFFLLIFLFQVALIFQGLDFTDEGAHAIFYQQIFQDPKTVQYYFMYWFSGILGGAWLKLFPQLGLWGIRLAGVLITTSTIMLVFNLLKKYLNPLSLKAGLLVALLMLNNFPRGIFYDNVSSLFFVITLYFLFDGLTRNIAWKFVAGGVFVALNIFTRIPNIVEAGLVIVIFYYGYISRISFTRQMKQALLFISGIIIGSLLLFLLMKILGHYEIFINSLKVVAQMGASHENAHGIKKLIKDYIIHYSTSILAALLVLAVITAFTAIGNFIKKTSPGKSGLVKAAGYFILVILLSYFIYKSSDPSEKQWYFLLYFLAGTIFISGFLIITDKNQGKEFRLLTMMGAALLLILPSGSYGDMLSVARESLWIALPVTFHYLYSIKSINNKTILFFPTNSLQYTLMINEGQINNLRKYGLFLTLVIALCYNYYYPFFDLSNRMRMHYTVSNDHLKGIYTTKERAACVSELLDESRKYIQKGDYLLAYDCIPMFYYLTETKPYMYNPWPWLYDAKVFKAALDSSFRETGKIPVVIIQKVNTINSNWPENATKENYFTYTDNKERNEFLNDFLSTHHYKLAWENIAFKIMVPVP